MGGLFRYGSYVGMLIVEFSRIFILLNDVSYNSIFVALSVGALFIAPILIFMIACNEKAFYHNFKALIVIKFLYIIASLKLLMISNNEFISFIGKTKLSGLAFLILFFLFDIITILFYYRKEKYLCKLYQ